MLERAVAFFRRNKTPETPEKSAIPLLDLPPESRDYALFYLAVTLGGLTRIQVESLAQVIYQDLLDHNIRPLADVCRVAGLVNKNNEKVFQKDTFLNHVALVYSREEMEAKPEDTWLVGTGPARPLLSELFARASYTRELFWNNKFAENTAFKLGPAAIYNAESAQRLYDWRESTLRQHDILILAEEGRGKNRLVKKPSREILEANRFLSQNGIFPTQRLREFIIAGGSLEDLKNLQEQTSAGRFDPQNPLQKDLEYGRYLETLELWMQTDELNNHNYQTFLSFDFVVPEEEIVGLTLQEKIEARATAYEAARLYWFIKERVVQGRKIIVIGNQRYGDFFVVSPIKKYLDELGVKVGFLHVPSSGTNVDSIQEIFSETSINYLIKESPDVIIVDGTSDTSSGGKSRFSTAMLEYLNWFIAFNDACGASDKNLVNLQNRLQANPKYQGLTQRLSAQQPKMPYKVTHWIHPQTEQVVFGNWSMEYSQPSNKEPEVIFVNPVIDPEHFPGFPTELKTHQPAFWDDPEKRKDTKTKTVFTAYGVKNLYGGRTTEQIVKLAQDQIDYVFPEMLQRTDPTFQ